jgi:hypothetical protein
MICTEGLERLESRKLSQSTTRMPAAAADA